MIGFLRILVHVRFILNLYNLANTNLNYIKQLLEK
jgi:hypothetical protein